MDTTAKGVTPNDDHGPELIPVLTEEDRKAAIDALNERLHTETKPEPPLESPSNGDIPIAPEDIEEIRQLQKQINDAHTNLGILEVQYETERTKFLKQLDPLGQQMELSQRRLANRYKIPLGATLDLDAGVAHLPK